MNPATKRFQRAYGPIADALASVDIDQRDREKVALAVRQSLEGRPDFRPDVFELLASDPLVPCAGGCGTRIRIPMHDSHDPAGRSAAWRERAPYGSIRCVSCGPPR